MIRFRLSAVNDRHLTLKALGMALKRRCPDAGLLHHSDQGCTYASEDYQRMLDAYGITRRTITENDVDAEIARMTRKSGGGTPAA